jgi:L-iditol 2-dehydrogenase
VLEVAAAGICGTDLHIADGEYETVTPVTIGHEAAGVVNAVGEGVDDSWLGARVASETYFSTCGECAFCRAGRPNLCLQRRSIGTHVDGAFAPRLLVPLNNLLGFPTGSTSASRRCASRSPASATLCWSRSRRC